MKQKITVQLSEPIVARLETAAERGGKSKTTIVEAALDRFLNPDAETIDDAALLRRLDGISGQLEQLKRDLTIVNETAALHARYHLTVTPPLERSRQRAACVLGLERFEIFAAQVGRRVQLGMPLISETLDRLSVTNPDLLASDVSEGAHLGAPAPDGAQRTLGVVDSEPKPAAAGQEDGSSGSFPAGETDPAR